MPSTPAWWRTGLLAVAAVAVAVRVVFALALAPDLPRPGDASVYREMARSLAAGEGLEHPPPGGGEPEPSAEHPPVFPAVLAVLDLVGLESATQQGAALGVLSGLGVVLVARLGRRLAGPAAGLTAAAIAAVHPMWFQSAGLVLSESLHLVLVPLVLLAAIHLHERPSAATAALAGAAVALAGLNRPESLALLVAVVVPAALMGSPRWRAGLPMVAVAVGTVAVLVVPWLVRNELQVGGATLATNSGKTLMGSNCAGAYHGPRLGGFDSECFFGAAAFLVDVGRPGGGRWDAKSFDDELGRAGREYLLDHADRLPVVVSARVARMWGFAFHADQRSFDVEEGRHPTLQHAGQWLHLALLPLAIGGAAMALRRPSRRRDALLLVGPVVVVTATCLLIYGGTRMRSGAEPSIALFAAFALVRLVAAARARGAGSRVPDGSTGSVEPA